MTTNLHDICPHCRADLRGAAIPPHPRYCGWYPPDATHYSRKLARYDTGRDRVTEYSCPDCGGTWARDSEQ